MKFRLAIAAFAAAPALSACTTDEIALFGDALSLYSDISYLNGDCPFGLNKYYDRDGHHFCTFDDDVPQRGDHHHRRRGHHDKD